MNLSTIRKTALITAFFFGFSFYANAAITISPLKHELTIEQWASQIETIKVTNRDSTAITLYTSTEDFIAWDDSGQPKFVTAEEQSHPELSLANWITLTEWNITLAPNETREVKFTVNVPEWWEPGWHYWAIFFSPEATWGQISIVQRLWVLVLIDVPGEVKIGWEFKSTEVWSLDETWEFKQNTSLDWTPVVFSTVFENTWNIHLKPKWKIEITDEDWEPLRNIWKEPIVSAQWAFIWEKQVDYIPLNPWEGNVLPNSERRFNSNWEWFGYPVISEDWTKKIAFRSLTEYYAKEISNEASSLNFWEQIKTKQVKKPFTANIYAYYEWKDKEKKELRTSKNFRVAYTETYVWLNMALIWWAGFIVLILILYFFIMAPKNNAKKEKALREKIMEEINNK